MTETAEASVRCGQDSSPSTTVSVFLEFPTTVCVGLSYIYAQTLDLAKDNKFNKLCAVYTFESKDISTIKRICDILRCMRMPFIERPSEKCC